MKTKKFIRKRQRAGREMRHVLLAIVRHAIRNLGNLNRNPEKNIHRLRVAMKKIRSLLRMAEPNFDPTLKKAVARRIRSIKNTFTKNREHAVLTKTLTKLNADPIFFKKLIGNTNNEILPSTAVMTNLLREMKILEKEISALPIRDISFDELFAQFSESLRKMKENERKCVGKFHRKKFHKWRKRAKDVGYQNEMLDKFGKGKKFSLHIGRLGDLLGESNDLAVLEKRLKASRIHGKQALMSRIKERNAALREKAFHKARAVSDLISSPADQENAAETRTQSLR